MNRIILSSVVLMTTLLLTSCGNNNQENGSKEENARVSTEKESKIEEVQINDATLNAVYQEYLNLSLALVNSNDEEAKISANAIALGAKELSNGAELHSLANEITEAGTLAVQRSIFSDLSNALILLVKSSGAASGKVYVDYCPMANNNQGGYWLSSEEGIRNPYYGESMLTCGETKEII